MPDLAELEIIASNMPQRTVTLSGNSVAVLLSALDACNRWHDWFEDGIQVDYAAYADVLEFLSQARYELMTVQIGEIKATAAATIPAGCLLCDGSIYEKVDYPDLYASLAPAFIVDSDSFSVPDLRGRFVWGSDASFPIGSTGGETAHTLTIGEIPSHSHTIPLTTTTLAFEPGEIAVVTPIPILTANTGDTGGDGSHNNMPPYLALQYYIVAL
jgi:microcystin-dependent protein